MAGGDRQSRAENRALEASRERACQEKKKQKTIADLPTFELSEKAKMDDLRKFIKERLARYEKLKSFDICATSVVTPPHTDGAKKESWVTYHIVDITRQSVDNPNKYSSVLQLLVQETDNYIIGFRRTPDNRNDSGGFFVFSDIKIPEFFGFYHILISCGSKYTLMHNIQISDNILMSVVESFLRVDEHNYRFIQDDTKLMMQTSMMIFGECQRMKAPLDFVTTNYISNSPVKLSPEVARLMNNWSYLSKAIFDLYLGLLEVEMGVSGSTETYKKGRKSVSAAVKKLGESVLDLKDSEGNLALCKLAQCVPLMKYDKTHVNKLIMRRTHKYTAQFSDI